MPTYTVTILDKRVNVIITYEVEALSTEEAETLAILLANLDTDTPRWLSTFEAVHTEVQ